MKVSLYAWKSIAKADVDLVNCTQRDTFVFLGLELSKDEPDNGFVQKKGLKINQPISFIAITHLKVNYPDTF